MSYGLLMSHCTNCTRNNTPTVSADLVGIIASENNRSESKEKTETEIWAHNGQKHKNYLYQIIIQRTIYWNILEYWRQWETRMTLESRFFHFFSFNRLDNRLCNVRESRRLFRFYTRIKRKLGRISSSFQCCFGAAISRSSRRCHRQKGLTFARRFWRVREL